MSEDFVRFLRVIQLIVVAFFGGLAGRITIATAAWFLGFLGAAFFYSVMVPFYALALTAVPFNAKAVLKRPKGDVLGVWVAQLAFMTALFAPASQTAFDQILRVEYWHGRESQPAIGWLLCWLATFFIWGTWMTVAARTTWLTDSKMIDPKF